MCTSKLQLCYTSIPKGEIVNTLPPLSQSDYARLKSSIAQDGQHVSILRNSNTGEIIDGEHRLRICQELGIEPLIEDRDLDTKEATRLKLTLNLARRHLTVEQKQELVKELRAQKWTQREIAEVVGVTRKTARKLEGKALGKIPNAFPPDLRYKLTPKHQEEIAERVETGETQRQIAADYGISRQRVGQIKKKIVKQKAKEEARDAEPRAQDNDILTGDFHILGRDVADDSVDLIFTDPPYGKEYIPDYEKLAQFAARVLKPGGSLICYTGQSVLPDVLEVMLPHLKYWWTICVEHSGPNQRFPGKWIFIEWKPLIWLVKEGRRDKEFVADHVRSKPDKQYHEWGQGIEEALYYIKHLTKAGELVCDPFCGGGTTCAAAKMLDRRYLAFEIDPKVAEGAKKRIANVT